MLLLFQICVSLIVSQSFQGIFLLVSFVVPSVPLLERLFYFYYTSNRMVFQEQMFYLVPFYCYIKYTRIRFISHGGRGYRPEFWPLICMEIRISLKCAFLALWPAFPYYPWSASNVHLQYYLWLIWIFLLLLLIGALIFFSYTLSLQAISS